MELIKPNDAGYDEARKIHNAMIDKRPAVIAACASPSDVVDALQLAEREGYDVAVRAGGHSVAGMSLNDGGIVIDTRAMNTVEVDAAAGTARVGGGAIWGEFDRAAQEKGLATTGGRVSTTGVAGFTLGGGSGWLERRIGLACDNLVSVDLVTADGRQVTASENENSDLFWALHGGGGNFGVATSFVFRMAQVGPEVTAGLMLWPGDAATEVGRVFRDTAPDAPDELGSGFALLTGPPEEFVPAHLQGTTIAGVIALWSGPAGEGADVLKPFRDLKPDVDLVGPMPYADFQCMLDDPPGLYNYWSADYHDSFPNDALDVFIKYGFEKQSPTTQQLLLPWGGARWAHVSEDTTPMTKRTVSWISHPFATWENPADSERNIEWARAFRRDIAHYATGGVYLNFIGDEGEDRVRAAYGDKKYQRLATIKAEWDPNNVFRGNQNIKPAA